ncbi:MAG: hypothetical protein M1167_08055, partial [Chloroflexi bacterium]|nr:hypothetical protein [Chloroflexota bacterium]
MTKQTPQTKRSLTEKLKERFKKTSDRLHETSQSIKLRIKAAKSRVKKSMDTKKGIKSVKPIKLPKIHFKVNLSFKKKRLEPEVPSATKTLPKDVKIIEKYPLYEPFAQV